MDNGEANGGARSASDVFHFRVDITSVFSPDLHEEHSSKIGDRSDGERSRSEFGFSVLLAMISSVLPVLAVAKCAIVS